MARTDHFRHLTLATRLGLVMAYACNGACFFNPMSATLEGTTAADGSTATAFLTDPTDSGITSTTGSTSATTGSTTNSGISGDTLTTTGMMTTSTSIPGTSTTGITGCSGDDECNSDPDRPFCVDDECVGCDGVADSDAACTGANPATPVCHVRSGRCVVCTITNDALCTGATPVCDGALNDCVACAAQADCPESACNPESGACFPTDNVLYVDGAAQCDLGDGSMATPFCQIDQALALIGVGDPSAGWTIKVKTGNYIQPALVVPDGAVLAIIGDGGIAKIRSTTAATLQTGTGSHLILSRLNLASNAESSALECTGSQVSATDLTLSLNKVGYTGIDCSAEFHRSVFYKNSGGAMSAFGAGSTSLVNSYISNNGSNAESDYGGLQIGQGQELSLLYATVVNNLSNIGARSLQCTGDAGSAIVRNSVIIAFVPPSIVCPALTVENSAIDEGDLVDDSNIPVVMADVAVWFEPQVGGVYHVKPDVPIAGLAIWKNGDPTTDYDGDARPAVDGETDYAGADRAPL